MNASIPLVSIVIPTHNDVGDIGRCLDSITAQTYENIEIIVVDDLSTDGTVEESSKRSVEVIEAATGMAEARNVGFESATGDFVYHVDADMELTPRVVEECVEYCTEREYDALIVPERNIGHSYWTNSLKFGKKIHRRNSDGNLRFLRSDLYERIGGHNPDRLSGEDWDLHRRITEQPDTSVGHIDTPVNHHLDGISLQDILRKKRRYAESQQKIDAEQRRELSASDNIKRNLRHADLFLKDPFHAIGFVLINLFNACLIRFYRYRGS